MLWVIVLLVDPATTYGYEEILAHYHSKYHYDILFSWRHAPKQGSLCIRLQNSPTALNPMFNCGNCVVRVEDLSLSSPNMSNIHVPKQFKSSIIRPKHRTELIFTFQKKKKNSVWLEWWPWSPPWWRVLTTVCLETSTAEEARSATISWQMYLSSWWHLWLFSSLDF